jgi:hypothetical protein
MDPKDLVKPGAIVLGLAAATALGFAAGYLMARNPELARRAARALAGGWERVGGALAESREELADLWAEAREDARTTVEDEAFAAATVASVGATMEARTSDAAVEPPPPAPATQRKTKAPGPGARVPGKARRIGSAATPAASA